MDENRHPGDRALADRGWRGYDLRATVPHLAVAAVASAVLLAGRWSLAALSGFADRAGALAVYATALAVWPGLLAVLTYRAVTYTYRLTDRALLVDRGFLYRPEPPAWLADVTGVASGGGWLGRRLGVGWVRLETTAGRVVWLTGVRGAGKFAAQIRETAAAAKTCPPPGRPG
ncbi:MAG: hypothetical protein JWO38_6636 [Gemmataceae bacterium]|nr:hypothetical protein [Gemmataceae bacterium]